MNKNEYDTDIKLRKLLKDIQEEVPENGWFTRKVMNRLPDKKSKSHDWVMWCFYCVALIICIGFWSITIVKGDIVNDFMNAVTTHTLSQTAVTGLVAMAITGVIVWQMAATLLRDNH